MGERGIAWVSRRPGFGALAVTRDDRVAWTPLVDALLLTHAPGRGDVAYGGHALTPLSAGPG